MDKVEMEGEEVNPAAKNSGKPPIISSSTTAKT